MMVDSCSAIRLPPEVGIMNFGDYSKPTDLYSISSCCFEKHVEHVQLVAIGQICRVQCTYH